MAGLSVLPPLLLLLQTPRQALLAGTELPWVGASALMVKGRARGHSKSFTNIPLSFIIFALPTAAHEYKSSRNVHPPQCLIAVWGSALDSGHQEHRRTQGPDGFQGQRDDWARSSRALGPLPVG